MDVNLINPFVGAITGVLPQLGFTSVTRKGLSLGSKSIKADGVVLNLGIVGEKTGNVVYAISEETAKKIASTMMMGMPVDTLDDMAKSAVSEMSNMITANSTINFSNDGVNVDISVPTMLCGSGISIEMSKDQVITVIFDVDGMEFTVHVSID